MRNMRPVNREIALFEGIEKQELEALMGCLKAYTRSYSAGEFILLDQDQLRHVGIVLRGMVHMVKEDHTGHNTLLTYLEEGELFGENYVLGRKALSEVSFYAAADTEILFLSLEHLTAPCRSACPYHARLVGNAFRLLGEEYHRLVEKIEICARGSLREKILAYLSLLSEKQGQKYITVPLSRTEMAAFLQANRSAMTRELAAMRQEGLIDFDGNTFVLR